MTGETEDTAPEKPRGGGLDAWLRLLRAPNLLTVPGDAMAGFAAASTATGQTPGAGLALAASAGLCLYMFGLVSNDVLDFEEDSRDRPTRPLPAGRIPMAQAYAAGAALGLAGVALAFWAGYAAGFTALVLLCTIVLYNAILKHNPVGGPIVMGFCRGLDVMLGAAAARPDAAYSMPVVFSALLVTFYIAGLTALASKETKALSGGPVKFLPAAAAALGFAAVWAVLENPYGDALVPAGVLTAGAILWPSFMAASLPAGAPPAAIQEAVGGLIRNLLFIEAALIAFFRPELLYLSAALLLAFPISRRISRRFYAS